ncbi:MAG: phosphotransferase [Chloroflexota bacterium]|nr:phosphotransferase [Chloroflexota bacterium]
MGKPTILLVDNREDILSSTRDFLAPNGYVVRTAKDEQEALLCCEQEVIHLVVIDIRLVDDRDEEDWSGLRLAAVLDPSFPKIILTGQQYPDRAALVRRVLGPDEQGNVLAADFVWKKEGPGKLLEAIQRAFRIRIRLNMNLKFTWEKGLTWRTLVDQLKLFRESSRAEKMKAEQVLKDLICRLFHNANRVHFLRPTPGRGPCAVVLVRPFFNGAEGTVLAVKFGPRDSIVQEVERYQCWVVPFAATHSTQLRGEPAWSRELGAIAYQFVPEDVDRIIDFSAYYRDNRVSNSAVVSLLEDLFQESCGKWYKARRPPTEAEKKRLDVWYREQLNLLDASQIQELRDVLSQLLTGKQPLYEAFRLLDSGLLQMKIGETTVTLQEPVSFAMDRESSMMGSNFFPIPSQVAITHGDLNGTNVLVDRGRRTWLIDFYKTGWGPSLRDFAELESVIKFELLTSDSLLLRWDLERALLAPQSLDETLRPNTKLFPQQARALAAIQRLRKLARLLTDTDDVREYYVGLLFCALKEIVGFSSASTGERCCTIAQYHALLSAAMICDKLVWSPSDKKGLVFLAHEYQEPWIDRIYMELKNVVSGQNYGALHPKDEAPGGMLWDRIAEMIERASLGLYEITTMNGNVCFELGYAMGAQKPFFALVNESYVNKQEVPNILGGAWWVAYKSDNELKKKVESILSRVTHAGPLHFFEQKTFARRRRQVKTRKNSALIATANVPRQREDILPVLEDTLQENGIWKVDQLSIEREKDISELYLKIVEYGLVVGSFASDDTLDAGHANAELALALGLACGAQKKVIILQEEGCKVLANVRSLTHKFRGKEGARDTLQAELKRQFPARRPRRRNRGGT